MSSFSKTNTARAPFGKNVYLRSTKDIKTESYTFAKGALPAVTIDGERQFVLQPGTVIAKITSGPDTGKVGVFQAAGTDEVQTLTESGAITSGTYGLTVMGVPVLGLAFNATAATVQAAVRAAIAASTSATPETKAIGDGITVTGGPVDTAPLVFTFNGEYGADIATIVVDNASLVGGTVTVSTGTPGTAGATDGRQTTSNIVGINDTFLPWQLAERDVEIAVVYEASCVQTWCLEYNGSGAPTALSNTTRDAIVALPTLALLFH